MNYKNEYKTNIAVIILNYNSYKHTITCLNALLCMNTRPKWIIVIDNKSTNSSIFHIEQWMYATFTTYFKFNNKKSPERILANTPKEVHEQVQHLSQEDKHTIPYWLIACPNNKGYAGGNNLGITLGLELGANAVWILNNDTEPTPKSLDAMTQRLFSAKRPGLCGSLMVYAHDRQCIQCKGGGRVNCWTMLSYLEGFHKALPDAIEEAPEKIEQRLHFIYGASVMAHRNFITTVGLMDESYFLYSEEQDWAFTAKGRFDLSYAPEAIVYHHEGMSTGWPYANTILGMWRIVRSRLRLTLKHNPLALPLVCIAILFAGLRMAWRRATFPPKEARQ